MNKVETHSLDQLKKDIPEFRVGDTVRVHVQIKEGEKERVQVYTGTVISRKHGSINETICVRRVAYGVACERIFPIHSPRIAKIEVEARGDVKRAKLYYLRDRVGKAAKIREKARGSKTQTK